MPVLGKVGLVNKGEYSSSASYTALDFVQYDGSTYVAKRSVSGVTPSNDGTNWQYMARGASLALENDLLATVPGVKALDANQGRVLKGLIDNVNESLSKISDIGTVYGGVAQSGRTISMSGNNCRGVIFGCSTVENRTFLTYIYSAASGAWNHVDIQKGSNITISGDTTTTLSITSSSSVLTSCRIISWGGELTVSNPA